MGTPQHAFVTETGQPSQRRRKSRLACNPCRARKTGCDGRKPVCSACSLRGWEDKCGYPDSVLQPSAALTLVDLDRRIQKLESEGRADSDAPRNAAPDVLPATGPPFRPVNVERHQSDRNDKPPDAADDLHPFTPDDPLSFLRHGLEAAGTRRPCEPAFGSESPISEAASEPTSEPTSFPEFAGLGMKTLNQPLDEIDRHALVLPPRPFADNLLRWYWQNFHSVFPFLHWPTFESKYRALWKQEDVAPRLAPEEVLFHATLNMVLALGSLRNEAIPSEERPYHGDEFNKRSLRLVSTDSLDPAFLGTVQLLLIRALYLCFSGRAERAWIMSGAAVRAALSMGLHDTPKKRLNQLEREMRGRVWFGGCVLIETVLSSTSGHPSMISQGLTKVPPPQSIDEEYLSTTEEGRQPERIPSRMDYILYTANKVIPMLGEMRSISCAPRVKITQAGDDFMVPDPAALLHINSRIDELFHGLPPHLRHDADYSQWPGLSEDTIHCFRTQTHSLRFRLLILRIFLLRPSVLAEAQRWTMRKPGVTLSPSSVLQERFHHEVCVLCLDSVHTILEEIHSDVAATGGIFVWYSLAFAFTTATILLIATLSPMLGVNLHVGSAKVSWDRAMAILEFYKANVSSAEHGIAALKKYRESISRRAAVISSTWTSAVQEHPNIITPQSTYQAQGLPSQQPSVQPSPHGGPYEPQPPTWGAYHAIPTPPTATATTGVMQALDEYLASDSVAVDQPWLSTQDFGQGDWLMHFESGSGGPGGVR